MKDFHASFLIEAEKGDSSDDDVTLTIDLKSGPESEQILITYHLPDVEEALRIVARKAKALREKNSQIAQENELLSAISPFLGRILGKEQGEVSKVQN